MVFCCKENQPMNSILTHCAACDSDGSKCLNDSEQMKLYTIEPRGNGYTIYEGRSDNMHGFNLGDVTGVDMPRMQKLLDRANRESSATEQPSRLEAMKRAGSE